MKAALTFATLNAGVIAATVGRPVAWTAVGLALSGLVVLVTSPPIVRARFATIAVGTAIVAMVTLAPWLATTLG